jgi:hypothetical protein
VIGSAPSILIDTGEALHAMTEMLIANPTLTLCPVISCAWCRELERNLGLYDLVENPRIFQRNPIVRQLLHTVNGLRINDSHNAERIMGIIRRAYRTWQG